MLSDLKPLNDADYRGTSTSSLSPTPTERSTGTSDGFSVVIDGYETNDNTILVFTVSGGKGFSAGLNGNGTAVVIQESGTAGNSAVHYSVNGNQDLSSTAWTFTVKLLDSAGSDLGAFVFSKAKADEDVLV